MLNKELKEKVRIATETSVYWIAKNETMAFTQQKAVVYFCDSKDKLNTALGKYQNEEKNVDVMYLPYNAHEDVLSVANGCTSIKRVSNTRALAKAYHDGLSDRLQSEYTEDDIYGLILVCFVSNSVVSEQAVMYGYLDLRRCEKCGKWHTVDEMQTKTGFCSHCDALYTRCPACHQIVPITAMIHDIQPVNVPLTADERDRYKNGVCSACIKEITTAYKQLSYYHQAPGDTPLFYNASRPNTPLAMESENRRVRYFGIEFEMSITEGYLCEYSAEDEPYIDYGDCLSSATENVLLRLARHGFNRHIYAEQDSSLAPYGAEFITNPMTLDFIAKKGIVDSLYSAFDGIGFEANDSCGMHVHVNRNSLNKYSVAKMNAILYALEYRDDEDYVISRISERENGLSEWSEVIDFYDLYHISDSERYPYIYDRMRQSGRYVALNSQNQHTIEFRFFAATDDAQLVVDRLYFINTLCGYANNHTLDDCMHISVAKLVEWDNRCRALFARYYSV